ncbi:FKBP-type peptidyl-prolyl cis-trans isomerase [Brevundimonas sp.]|uniref:FKBP-type peptidyl-prolyl cis-trans isomerase n=1 Tax=Brevundimonas sp. TaxID=1871086 RepID=UPI0025DE32EC|nr:FKBP-type peptidyl-prolyl cis-trans isomerase [Brevundimonas sp.]
MFSSATRALLAAGLSALALSACNGAAAPDETSEAERAAAFFMESNARAEGVHVLESGVQYKVVRSGDPSGPQPDSNDLVRVNYEGALTDGTVFDSSYRRGVPAAMPLDRLIPAWQEAIPHMHVGDEWLIYVPPEQGYGAEGSPPEIPPHSVLVFRVELLGVAEVPGGEAASARA